MTDRRVKSEYAASGVDYTKIEPFKMAMVRAGKRTLHSRTAGACLSTESAWAPTAPFIDIGRQSLSLVHDPGRPGKQELDRGMDVSACRDREDYYEGIGIDTALMAANDVICQGALPVIFTDEVAAGDSEWFGDEKRSHDLAESFYQACEMCGWPCRPANLPPSAIWSRPSRRFGARPLCPAV